MREQFEGLSNAAYIGIGGCGRNILKTWRDRLPDGVLCMEIDRDDSPLARSRECEQRFLLTRVKCQNSTMEYADSACKEIQKSMAEHLTQLDKLLSDQSTVVLLAGLGGVVGTWVSQILCNHLVAMNKHVITVLTMPLGFETERVKVADLALPDFDANAQQVLCLNNHLIKHTPEGMSMADAFDMMNEKAFELLNNKALEMMNLPK